MNKAVQWLGLLVIGLYVLSGYAGAQEPAVAISQYISGQAIADTAASAVRQKIGTEVKDDDISIIAVYTPQDMQVAGGAVDLSAELPYGVRYNVPTVTNVIISQDGRIVGKVAVRFNVTRFQQVVVAKSGIAAKEVLAADKLGYDRRDIGRLAPGYLTDIDNAVGLVSRYPLALGTVVNESMLAKPILIKRGAMVNIVARFGGIEVKSAGQSLQDGSEGQLIRVQNVNSKKIVSARVLDETAVQVLTHNGR